MNGTNGSSIQKIGWIAPVIVFLAGSLIGSLIWLIRFETNVMDRLNNQDQKITMIEHSNQDMMHRYDKLNEEGGSGLRIIKERQEEVRSILREQSATNISAALRIGAVEQRQNTMLELLQDNGKKLDSISEHTRFYRMPPPSAESPH